MILLEEVAYPPGYTASTFLNAGPVGVKPPEVEGAGVAGVDGPCPFEVAVEVESTIFVSFLSDKPDNESGESLIAKMNN